MDDELLIALVRNHRAFYDVSDPGYNDNAYKYKVWVHISSQLNVDVSSCKARWNNLRDNYRKSLKKNTTRSAQAKKTKLYKYADQLNFLDEFFEERRAKGLAECPREDEYNDDVIEEVEDDEEEMERKPEYAESIAEYNDIFQCRVMPVPEEKLEKLKMPRKISHSKVPVAIAEKPLEYRIEQHDTQSPHPVDAFLAGIAPTLKTFSPYYLNLAKSEIFAAVQKYEMRMLEPQFAYAVPGSSFIRDITIIAPPASHSDSASPPKASYED